jgi:hypothetical protein
MNEFASLLSVEAKALTSEQPLLWEFRLYAQVLIDEVARNKSLPFTPAAVHIPRFEDGAAWLGGHLDALQRIVSDATDLINADHEDAWGAPGQAGNVAAIVRFALQMAAFHRQTLEWSETARRAELHPLLKHCAYEMSFFANAVLRPIENQGPSILRQCDVIVAAPPGTPATLDASIVFVEFDRTRFSAACAAAASTHTRG